MKRVNSNYLLQTCLTNINNNVNSSNENIKNIVVDSTTLGYESILTDVLDGMSNLVYKGLFGIRDMILNTSMVVDDVKQYSTTTPNIKRLNAISKNVSKVIKEDNLNIPKIYNTQSPIMLGLNVSLEEMYNSISGITIYTSNISTTLDNLQDFLDDISSSKISDIKTLLPRDNKIKSIESDNKTILTTLNTFNNTSIVSDRKPVKELISKISSLPILINDSIKLGKQFRIETLQDIHQQVVEISEMTTTVLKTINLKDNKTEIDKNTLYKLSNYLKVVAENITMISFSYYAYYSLLDMLVGVSKVVINTKPTDDIKQKEVSFTGSILSIFK